MGAMAALHLFGLLLFCYYMGCFLERKRMPGYLPALLSFVFSILWACIGPANNPLTDSIIKILALAVLAACYKGEREKKLLLFLLFAAVGESFDFSRMLVFRLLWGLWPEDGERIFLLLQVPASAAEAVSVFLLCRLWRCSRMEAGEAAAPGTLAGRERLSREEAGWEQYFRELEEWEQYFREMEEQNELVRSMRHDMKNQLFELCGMLEQGQTGELAVCLGALCGELEAVDEGMYTLHPQINSVLRVKAAMAKQEGIAVEISVQVPRDMRLAAGDAGILYGNLLDNAVEACRKVEEGNRFIRLKSRYMDGKLLIAVSNSKPKERAFDLETTKADRYSHGRGIPGVRRVAAKYNGTAVFEDRGDMFEASVLLYNCT